WSVLSRAPMDHVTLLRPHGRASSDEHGMRLVLPADLLEQVRGRVRVLALFLMAVFAFDPALALFALVLGRFLHRAPSREFLADLPFQWVGVAAAVLSAALWWVAGRRRVTPSRLLRLGLAYEIVICFVIAISTFWQYYVDTGILPTLTWLPIVV